MYRAYGLLLPKTEFDLDTAAKRLTAKIAGSSAARNGNLVSVSKGNWTLNIADVTGAHVPDETVGLTDKIAGFEQADAEVLAKSNRRIEVWTDDPDPFFEHYNDYQSAVEVLKSFPGVTAIDPNGPALL
ncbi:MAG: hypothetical protein K8U57_13170 [Planctomycetes bacterium]|nr:hypothetical protein [Planctomycetota bacterium]